LDDAMSKASLQRPNAGHTNPFLAGRLFIELLMDAAMGSITLRAPAGRRP
jgi:hypothetical protein